MKSLGTIVRTMAVTAAFTLSGCYSIGIEDQGKNVKIYSVGHRVTVGSDVIRIGEDIIDTSKVGRVVVNGKRYDIPPYGTAEVSRSGNTLEVKIEDNYAP